METVSVEIPSASSPSLLSVEAEPAPPLPRAANGTFLPGIGGNPSGRPLGSQNKASLIKSLIEDNLSAKLEKDALAIMQKAINLAKAGDTRMIKLLLGDMLAQTRAPESHKGGGAVQVNVKIDNYTRPNLPSNTAPTIDASFTEVTS